jgi:hypothetical protein
MLKTLPTMLIIPEMRKMYPKIYKHLALDFTVICFSARID